MHDVAWRCHMNCVRSKDAHKQLARTSLKIIRFACKYLSDLQSRDSTKQGNVFVANNQPCTVLWFFGRLKPSGRGGGGGGSFIISLRVSTLGGYRFPVAVQFSSDTLSKKKKIVLLMYRGLYLLDQNMVTHEKRRKYPRLQQPPARTSERL